MDDASWVLFQIPGTQIINFFFQISDFTFNIFKFMMFGFIVYVYTAFKEGLRRETFDFLLNLL